MPEIVSITNDEDMAMSSVENVVTGGGFGTVEGEEGTYEVFGMRLTTSDGKEHQFVLEQNAAFFIATSIIEWMDSMHDSGRCGCHD